MKPSEVVISTVSVVRWTLVTLLYAVFTPRLLMGSFFCLLSFLPHELWSFREIVTEGAFASSDAWKSGAITWHSFAQICFVIVCAARIVCSSFAFRIGKRIQARISEWIDAQLSDRQRWIGRIAFASVLGLCVVLGFAANRADRRAPPVIAYPSLESAPAAAAIRLSTGRVLSGEATVSARENGELLVRFKDRQ